ncbi:MAG: hypothetical protein CMF27_00395 [Kiritimatiellaceae bacterium]|jgi:hypothetical protein|nr:hypothetical protein [Kiritimatiellaceae bacterium]
MRPTLESKILCSFSISDQAKNKDGCPSKSANPVGLNKSIGYGGIIALLLKEGVAGDGVEKGDGPGDEHGHDGSVGPS